MLNNNKIKLNEIRISCSSHATEDLKKVKTAILNLLPEKLRKEEEIDTIEIIGHAGNTINLLEMTIKQIQNQLTIIQYFAEKIDEVDKIFLYEDIDTYLGEDNSLYLRFNKQDAFNETLTLDEKDNTIKVVIKFVVYKQEPDQLIDTLEKLGLIKKR
ncbi:MAG TPA: RNA-binding domain-containing protein [candidate division Zixibacteria bacterium]|nr:RNA-binding domain-containing protein [candidate division Zixibacteria bacterium]